MNHRSSRRFKTVLPKLAIPLTLAVLSLACTSTPDDESGQGGDSALSGNDLSSGHVCSDPSSLNAPLPCPTSKGAPDVDIAPGLVDNGALFGDEFYGRFPIHHRGAAPGDVEGGVPLALNDSISKNYFFPTRYRDATTAVAMFFCDWSKAKALMPHPEMDPVDMGLGRSLVVITSYRYNRVFGMKPYNEVAIAIPAVAGRLVNPPLLPLLVSDFKGLGFYVHSMPVSTLENNIRGHQLWGLPKVVREIDLVVDGPNYVTSVKDENGKTYLELRVPMEGDPMHVDSETFIFSTLDRTTYRSPSRALGDFTVTKFMGTLAVPLSILRDSKDTTLTLGDSPAAASLKALGIAPRPFQVRFSKGTESVFDLPDAQLDAKGRAVAPASFGAAP